MGEVSFLQYHHSVTHVAVHEVHPEVCMDFHPYLAPFHWECQ